jgi:anti-sigma factor RsiW
LDYLDEYVDGTLSPEVVEDFERHLARCPPCVAYLNTYRRTRNLVHKMEPAVLSDDMKATLRQFLLEHLV